MGRDCGPACEFTLSLATFAASFSNPNFSELSHAPSPSHFHYRVTRSCCVQQCKDDERHNLRQGNQLVSGETRRSLHSDRSQISDRSSSDGAKRTIWDWAEAGGFGANRPTASNRDDSRRARNARFSARFKSAATCEAIRTDSEWQEVFSADPWRSRTSQRVLLWADPATVGSSSQTEVTYRIVDTAGRAERSEVQQVSSDIRTTVNGVSKATEVAGLQLTSRGWEVPEQ